MRNVVSAFVLSAMFNGMVHAKTQESVENFDFEWEQKTAAWSYVDTGEKCGWATAKSGLLCGEEMMMMMYSRRNPASPGGYLREGFMSTIPNGEYGNALALTYTSGEVYSEDAGEVVYVGEKISSLREYESIKQNLTIDNMPAEAMPGQPHLIVQPHSGESPKTPMFNNKNRFNVYVWYPASPDRHWQYKHGEAKSPALTLAWYPFIDTARQGHYYHHITNRSYGGWMKVQFDANPSHANHGGKQLYDAYAEGGLAATGDGVDYFKRIASFSLRLMGVSGSVSPYTVVTDRWSSELVTDENEETIGNVGVGFDPEKKEFDISFEDKYRCGECDAKYEVKYAFSPFTQATYEASSNKVTISNYFVEDNVDPHVIVKPNPYYNQVWAKMSLPKAAVARYLSGDKIYFAVRDISDRKIVTQPIDHEIVSTDAGDRERRGLIKTIDIEYMPPPQLPEISAPNNVATFFKSVNVAMGRQGLADIYETKPDNGWSNVRDVSDAHSVLIGGVRGDEAYYVDLEGVSHNYVTSAIKRINIQPIIAPCNEKCENIIRDFSQQVDSNPDVVTFNGEKWQANEIHNMDLPMKDNDYLAVTVKNSGLLYKNISPHLLFHATGVDAISNADNVHSMGYQRVYGNGSERTWYYPLSTQESPSLHELTVMVPDDNQELSVTEVKVVR